MELGMVTMGILAVGIAYVLGSIPFAFIVTYLKKNVDIRRLGTGNVGTMNTAREIGLFFGIVVLLLDMAKGWLAIFIAQRLGLSLLWMFPVGFAAVSGHSWSLFLKFRGGRGVAATLGVLLALAPLEFSMVFIVILTIFLLTRNSGLAVGVGLVILPLVLWAFGKEESLILYSLIMAIFLGLRNILASKPDLKKMRSYLNSTFRVYPAFWHKRKG
jgi:glycerol-3-phosphate acyltransferase PlsY